MAWSLPHDSFWRVLKTWSDLVIVSELVAVIFQYSFFHYFGVHASVENGVHSLLCCGSRPSQTYCGINVYTENLWLSLGKIINKSILMNREQSNPPIYLLYLSTVSIDCIYLLHLSTVLSTVSISIYCIYLSVYLPICVFIYVSFEWIQGKNQDFLIFDGNK